MSNLIDFAKTELEFAFEVKDDLLKEVSETVLDLLEVFEKHNTPDNLKLYETYLFNKLAVKQHLGPLTGSDEEWVDTENEKQVNKRCPYIFRENKDNGTAFNIRGKVFIDSKGNKTFTEESVVKVIFPYMVHEPEMVFI